MAGNLSDRLKRIRLTRPRENVVPPERDGARLPISNDTVPRGETAFSSMESLGWVSTGYMVARREYNGGSIALPRPLPQMAEMVMSGMEPPWSPDNLLFFDLETTGLSGGAGTVAFLAAFGRLETVVEKASAKHFEKPETVYDIRITQYLLLDYPGEYDFTGALLGEIDRGNIIVSYNGKSFDSQILKTRCLMNGLVPPEYRHADLLYPARRLWKTLLSSCSQGTVETEILGLDRTGDMPGVMAPDIWFSFLKNGETSQLMEICEHNLRDIAGLAAIFSVMTRIAADPVAAAKTVPFDFESLAIRWHDLARRRENRNVSTFDESGLSLLKHAACMGYLRAEFRYAKELIRNRQFELGREWLMKAASAEMPSGMPDMSVALVQAAALRSLAIDSERRLGNIAEALDFCARGLALLPAASPRRLEFERRQERLEACL